MELHIYKFTTGYVHTHYNPKDTRKKNEYDVILKIRFYGSIRVPEGSNDRQSIYLEGFRTP